jgi:hypothetical protein
MTQFEVLTSPQINDLVSTTGGKDDTWLKAMQGMESARRWQNGAIQASHKSKKIYMKNTI